MVPQFRFTIVYDLKGFRGILDHIQYMKAIVDKYDELLSEFARHDED